MATSLPNGIYTGGAVKFDGEGKLFKTEKDWRDYYAKTYFGEG